MQRVRIVLWAAVAIALAAFAFLMLRPVQETPTRQQPLAISSIGGPFTLTGSDGKPFSSASLAGKPYAIFFGFTHCPDVCPTTLGAHGSPSAAAGRRRPAVRNPVRRPSIRNATGLRRSANMRSCSTAR